MTKQKVDIRLFDYVASQETPPPEIRAALLICDIKDCFQEVLSNNQRFKSSFSRAAENS
jgi:hypothetical protein